MSLHIPFDNSYAQLPDRFYHRQSAEPVRAPALIAVNDALAKDLGINPAELRSDDGLQVLAGNTVPNGAEPLAQAYSGHQFGGWNPQLGDGRALLLGEVVSLGGQRFDLQLKGSGRTPFSRMGDGRAWVGPVLREYLVSEAMHAMGIPTTRALAAVTTGEVVLRDGPMPGAVLTRIAASHIRVGTFQYFAGRGDEEGVRLLTEHVIARHYPTASGALGLLDAVVAAQAKLVARWMGVGFIHGVMNTDNCQIAGETIDYGPCAFMDSFESGKVFSSIDRRGRYAYDNQANMAVWNLAQLATSLLPLIHDDADTAVELATQSVHSFPTIFNEEWLSVFSAKLGLQGREAEDRTLISDLLEAMEAGGADFTNTFAAFATGTAATQFKDPAPYHAWQPDYAARLSRQSGTADHAAMTATNPKIIPRNHQVEAVITAAKDNDFVPFQRLLTAVTAPFATPPADLTRPPLPTEEITQTFCGT